LKEEDMGVYKLEGNNKFIDTLESSIITGYNWDKTFLYLGRHYVDHQKMPATLWSDLFALSMMFNDVQEGHILIQPCCAEMKEGKEEVDDQYCLTLLPPQLMSVIEPIPSCFKNHPGTSYTVIPVYMYDHNPHLLRSVESVYPLFYAKKSEDYISELSADLRLASSAIMDLTLEEPRDDWRELMLYEHENSTKEDMNRFAYMEKKKKDTADAKEEKKKAAVDMLNKKEEDEKARQKLEDENTHLRYPLCRIECCRLIFYLIL
jgi:hypothetical protein